MNKIKYGRQNISVKDIKNVKLALNSEIITTGNYVRKFEDSLKKYFNSKFVLTCSSGTAALHLAIQSIGIKKNDNVIIPIINFSALSNILFLQGKAKVHFADVDPQTGQVTPQTITQCIKKNNIKKVKAIFTMYLSGSPNNIVQFYRLKKRLNCLLIEDACHALGASYKFNKNKYRVGSAKHADISTFSFHPVKSITTGEGGAISFNKKSIYQFSKILRSHGIIRKNKKYWDYNIKVPGLNYRLSDINCSLGLSQLNRLKEFIKKRRYLVSLYKKYLGDIKNIKISNIDHLNFSSWHLLILLFDFTKIKKDRKNLINYLNKQNIYPQIHYIPLYNFSFYKFIKKKDFPNAEKFYKNCLSLPIHTKLAIKDVRIISNHVKKYLKYHEKKYY